jgi:hypothetical protein
MSKGKARMLRPIARPVAPEVFLWLGLQYVQAHILEVVFSEFVRQVSDVMHRKVRERSPDLGSNSRHILWLIGQKQHVVDCTYIERGE